MTTAPMAPTRHRRPALRCPRGAFPLGLLGMIALVSASETVLCPRVRTAGPVGRVEMSWNEAARAALGSEARADVLCVGDSLVKLGILPRVLEHRLGFRAYNLGVLGGQAPTTYFLLQKVLAHGNRPRALLVDFSEDLLALAPGLNPTCWPDSVGHCQGLELAWHSLDPALAISTGLHWLLPRWCDQSERPRLFGRLSESRLDGAVAGDAPVFERNWRVNRGAQVAPRAFIPVERSEPSSNAGWRPHPANELYVDRLLRLAEVHQIPAFWILTPSTTQWREQIEQNGKGAAYRKFIAGRSAKFPGLTVLDGQLLFSRRDAFRDPIHVNRDGAIELSLAVAEAIRPRLDAEVTGPRFIDLAAFADQETGKYQNLVEDLDQSRSAGGSVPIVLGQSGTEASAW
jgi:hypothetical protein